MSEEFNLSEKIISGDEHTYTNFIFVENIKEFIEKLKECFSKSKYSNIINREIDYLAGDKLTS